MFLTYRDEAQISFYIDGTALLEHIQYNVLGLKEGFLQKRVLGRSVNVTV